MQELAGQATTLENYVIDFDNDAVMFSHDGHGNPALGTPGAVSVKHSIYYTGVHGYGAGFEFVYEPGPITNLALVTVGGNRWRFVISEGELLPMEARPISAPQTLFRHHTLAVDEWCNGWLRAGAPHHMGQPAGPGRRSCWNSPRCSGSKPSSSEEPPACLRSPRSHHPSSRSGPRPTPTAASSSAWRCAPTG
jgi:hypothetical protein